MLDNFYEQLIIIINTANFMANMRNLEINEEILVKNRNESNKDDRIIELLSEILEELRRE